MSSTRSVLAVAVAALALVTLLGPARAKDGDAALLAKVDEIAAKVAKVRGLAIKRPIKRGVMTKDQIRARLLERIDQEYTPQELVFEELALKRLGLLPADADYKQIVVDLLTDQIAGFYDPWEKQLYIAGWQATGLAAVSNDVVMAHEIAHALQDQHFDLQRFMKTDKQNGDAVVARQALVEGDGTAVMIEFLMPAGVSPWADDRIIRMMRPQMQAQLGSGALSRAPLVLREGLVFPYLGGLEFVAHFRKQHPWRRIDAMYRRPPLSTEHILHPDKYAAYERPDEITEVQPAALDGYRRIYNNVTGELGWRIFLRQHGVAEGKANLAAAGWGGDRVAVYTPPGHGGGAAGAVAVSYSTWDAEADAIEFFEAAAEALATLAGVETAASRTGTHVELRGADGIFAVERRRAAVVLVIGAPATIAGPLREQVWKRWRVRRR